MSEPRPTEIEIQLDRLHRVNKSLDRWALRKQTPNGMELLDAWNGPVKSLHKRLEDRGIVPSRAAETALSNLSESRGFLDRSKIEEF